MVLACSRAAFCNAVVRRAQKPNGRAPGIGLPPTPESQSLAIAELSEPFAQPVYRGLGLGAVQRLCVVRAYAGWISIPTAPRALCSAATSVRFGP